MLLLVVLLSAQAGVPVDKEHCHRWTAPEWAPWEMSQLGDRKLGKAAAPIVFLQRAIVPHEKGVLWLQKEKDKWGYVGWRADLNISKDWLYRDSKKGTVELPENVADSYLDAIYANKLALAESYCTQRAWWRGKFSLETIFKNTRNADADLRRLAISQRNRRAYVLIKIIQRAVVKGDFYLTLSRRGSGWLIDGTSATEPDITGPHIFPSAPKYLVVELIAAFKERASWRIPKLAAGTFREALLADYQKSRGIPPGGKLVVDGNTASFGKFAFLKHRAGWRVAGIAK